MKIHALVVMYNSSLFESETIQHLFKANVEQISLKIIVWNNGPHEFDKDDVFGFLGKCKDKKIDSDIYQDTRNISLSKIYNFFVDTYSDSEYFTIFDQDTLVSDDFFINIRNNKDCHVIIPLIFSPTEPDEIRSPSYFDHKPFHHGEFNLGDCYAVGSCLTFSNHLKNLIVANGEKCFDENYAFYRVDTQFFFHIKKFNYFKGICIGQIFHHLSEKDDPSKMNQFKKLEIGYDKLLSRIHNRRKSFLKNILYCVRLKCKYRINMRGFINLIRCAINKKHPRTMLHIEKNKKVSYSSTFIKN
ncbi:hypothetical protein IG608_17950, partial [Pectobacterium sp. A113-S21-F16]